MEYPTEEAARLTEISADTITALIWSGKIETVSYGRKQYITENGMEQLRGIAKKKEKRN